MIIDGHAHACGSFNSGESIIKYLDFHRIDKYDDFYTLYYRKNRLRFVEITNKFKDTKFIVAHIIVT